MGDQDSNCVILADRNAATSEGIRGLLETEFDSVYLVSDAHSLVEGAGRLAPRLVVVDLSIGLEVIPELLRTLKVRSPASRVIILAIHDEPTVVSALRGAGTDAVVLKRCAGRDLFEALAAIDRGEPYVSPSLGASPGGFVRGLDSS